MEKRVVLAFTLSLLVLFLWEMYFGSTNTTQNQETQQQQNVSPPGTTPPQTGPASTPSLPAGELPGGRPAADSGKQYKQWMVESPLYRMELYEAGGRIRDFQLKDYKDSANPDARPMDLVPARTTGYLPFAVDSIRHPEWDLSTRPFNSNEPSPLKLSPEGKPETLTLTAEVPDQVRLTKSFTFQPNTYAVDVEVTMENLSSNQITDQVGVSFYYRPFGTEAESSYNESFLAFVKNGVLETTSGKDIAKKAPVIAPPFEWVGFQNNYFLDAFIPTGEQGGQVLTKMLDADKNLVQAVYLSDEFNLGPNQQKVVKMKLYMGPKELERLQHEGHHLEKSIDFGWFGFIARPMLFALRWLYGFVHNYGVVIILITVIIKILFWPLTQKSYKSMQMMKKLQPKINQVREKYKDDREKLNSELMMLYRTYKVNPLGGCLPMVLQIPVFFALYRMLSGSVELLHQPFALWMDDLTAPDRLYVGVSIPYLGGIPVLTILMGISMFIQQKMTPSTGDPRQEKIMLLMPVMFTFFFINFPSGLVLYWLVNNVLSIAQQYWVNRNA